MESFIRRSWVVCALLTAGCADGDSADSQGGTATGEESGSTETGGEGTSGSSESSQETSLTSSAEGSQEASDGPGTEDSDSEETDAEGTDTGPPEIPPGYCYDANHGGLYPCECTSGEEQPCEDGGVQVCIWFDEKVISGGRWSECLECAPGSAQECTTGDGAPGMQYCDDIDVHDRFLEDVSWGECVDATVLACDPIRDTGCVEGSCTIDDVGVPYCG